MRPLLSICIPTCDRPDLLAFCLDRVREFEKYGKSFEIVVSDGSSDDATAEVVRQYQLTMPYLQYSKQSKRVGPIVGFINAIRNSSGQFLVYLADDDSLIPNRVWEYVERLDRQPDSSAIFANWIAYDDEREVELHRYWHFPSPISFGPNEPPLHVVNFVLSNLIFPEQAIYRREALLACDCIAKRSNYSCHRWMYRLSRIGKITFELNPFYREHRVLKQRFNRQNWSNMEMRLIWMGDEMRNELEIILLWALQDSGLSHVPSDQALVARQQIDRYLHSRTMVEIQRTIVEKNWLLAADLRRRIVLWHGPGSNEEQSRDALEISIPAALQAVQEIYHGLGGTSRLLLSGFRTSYIRDFFRSHYPDIPLIDDETTSLQEGSGRILKLSKLCSDSNEASALESGYCLYLDQLLQQYGIGTIRIDMAGL